MCNQSTTATLTTLSTSTEKSSQTHLYFDLLQISNSINDHEKHQQHQGTEYLYPSISEIITEAKSLLNLAFPIGLTRLILYSRSIISMLFLGHLGDIQLAAGSLAIAFANITGYSVLSGLALGLHKPTWGKPSSECLTDWKPLLKLAAPSCISVCLEWWWYEIMIVLCGILVNPKAPVASMGILIQTTSLLYVFPSSLGFAVSTRVGNELGANRPYKARLSAVVAVFVSAMMGLSASTFASGIRDKWARMFTSDSEILRLTSIALPILGLCELGNCPQTVGCGVLRGSARPSTAANVNLGAFYLVGMPVAIGLGFYLGVGFPGFWLGLLSAQLCCAGLMLYVVGSSDWDQQAKRALMLTCADTMLPDDCDNNKGEEEQPLICIMVTSAA
ncbi:hypothetical protein CRYUN_Cryun03dG0007000 [Craigia yunnanensis]